MVKLHCEKCGHRWNYTGQNNDYATCPGCDGSVKIESSRGGYDETGGTTPVGIPEPSSGTPAGSEKEVRELRELVEENNRMLREILEKLGGGCGSEEGSS